MAPFESGLEVLEPSVLPEHHSPDVPNVPDSQSKMYARYGSEAHLDGIPIAQKYEEGAGDTWRHGDHSEHRDATRPQRILGMSPFLFGLVIALGTAVIVGGAVGGGVGSLLKTAKDSLSAW